MNFWFRVLKFKEFCHFLKFVANIRDENNSQLHIFIKRFNKLVSIIDFAALDSMFYNAMENLVDFVRLWNIKFFQRFGFRIEVLVLQVSNHFNQLGF